MTMSSVSIRPYGERAIEICWPQQIAPTILKDINRVSKVLKSTYGTLLEAIIPTYANLLLVYPQPIDFEKEQNTITQIITAQKTSGPSLVTRWFLPVCYDTEFGPDLMELSRIKSFSIDEVISIHSQRDYTIHFFGFLPGFFYLGGLDRRLEVARRAKPRRQVTKGTVAIGGSQTGIYPQDCPGGWQLIGRTPIELFDVAKNPPVFAQVGDLIKFVPVSKKEFHSMALLGSRFNLEREVIE
jgi:inhibitor of KinA